jgi:hypothetical protein
MSVDVPEALGSFEYFSDTYHREFIGAVPGIFMKNFTKNYSELSLEVVCELCIYIGNQCPTDIQKQFILC